MSDENFFLRALPATNVLLRTNGGATARAEFGKVQATLLARSAIQEARTVVAARKDGLEQGSSQELRAALLTEAEKILCALCAQEKVRGLRRVINATGVILHTNLGRAPLAAAARAALAEEAAGYCTLEYDLVTGERGRRGAQVEELLSELTGAEAALIVNNCAAATLLTLTALAQGGEGIVSRGELVEIGGDFRIPDVMEQSGARMVEVGTTNRTKLADYERAITERTRVLLRVHPSNYRIVGFTRTPTLTALAALAHERNLICYEDAGSGALTDLSSDGLTDEPVIAASVRAGADVVTFSGDKLLGACQAGLIVGRANLIERLRRHPLYRAVRADKLALAALAETLKIHLRETASTEIPVLRMLRLTPSELHTRAENFCRKLNAASASVGVLELKIIGGASAVGGGSAPTAQLPTALLAITHARLSAATLLAQLRANSLPVIARIADGALLMDLRTVELHEEPELIAALSRIVG